MTSRFTHSGSACKGRFAPIAPAREAAGGPHLTADEREAGRWRREGGRSGQGRTTPSAGTRPEAASAPRFGPGPRRCSRVRAPGLRDPGRPWPARPGRGGRRRLRPASHGTSGACRGGGMTWLSQRKRPRRRRGAGEATERAVSAAAPRSQRRSPGPVRLSAPGGCESAAAAEEESVGGRRPVGARRMRPLPGAPGVAAAAALWLLLLLPRARADEHEHTVRGAPGRRGRPRPAPRLAAPAGPARPGKPGGPVEPVAVRGRLPVGPGGAGTRELGGGISLRSWGRTPRPDLDGAPPLGLGLPRPGQERGEGPGSPRRGVGVAGRPG